jgi:3-oxoacyl-[acyl-carrier protein] reductase
MLKDKTAIITGAAGGIGAATAFAFAKLGATGIIIGDVDIKKANKTAIKIKEETGCNCIAQKVNVGSICDIERMFKTAADSFNGLDILVNCAGYVLWKQLKK